MSFLTPLFLLGGLAVALPIVFHLIRRTTREETLFSSLMFLRPTPPRVTRRSRLENILLLLLRCAVLLLLSLGFARPLIQRAFPVAASAEASSATVFLVDTSASMRRPDLWAGATSALQRRLRALPENDLACVVTFDQRPRTRVSFTQWSEWPAGDRVAGAQAPLTGDALTWAGSNLGAGLLHGVEMLEELGKGGRTFRQRSIVVISDLQAGSRLHGLQGFDWPRGVEVEVEPMLARRKGNAAVHWLPPSDAILPEAGGVTGRLRVENSKDADLERLKILGKGGALVGEVYVPPGQERVITLKDPVEAMGEWRVTGDAAEFDNQTFFVQPPLEEIRVVYLGKEADGDPNRALYYVQRALQRTRWQTVKIERLSTEEGAGTNEWQGAALVIVADPISPARAASLREHARQGGRIVVTVSSAAMAETVGRLAGVEGLRLPEAVLGDYAMLAQIDFQHPFFAPFADPRFSDFTKIHFWRYRQMDATALPQGRVLAQFDKPVAAPALVQVPIGSGAMVVFTFSWYPSESQFVLSSKFVPLLYAILDDAGARAGALTGYSIGEVVRFPDRWKHYRGAVIRPDGVRVAVGTEGQFAETDLPGIYRLDEAEPAFRFAVNVAAEESRTAPLPEETLQKLGVPLRDVTSSGARVHAAEAAQRHLELTELERRQRLWRWLIGVALGLVLLESGLAGRLTLRPAEVKESI